MPVTLDEGTAEDWMNPDERGPLRLASLLVPVPDDNLVLSAASSLVNNVNNDRRSCSRPRQPLRCSGAFWKAQPRLPLVLGSNRNVTLRTRVRRGICPFPFLMVSKTVARKKFIRVGQQQLGFDRGGK